MSIDEPYKSVLVIFNQSFGAVHSVRMMKQKILFVASFVFDERKKKERNVSVRERERERDKRKKERKKERTNERTKEIKTK